MTPEAILEQLDGLGVAVGLLRDGRVGVSRAAVALLPAQLRRQIVAYEPELRALVMRRERIWSASPPELVPWNTRPGQDPRPDLPGSDLWSDLLRLAAGDADDPAGTYGRLKAARACGAVLQWHGDRWRLAPTIDPHEQDSVWSTEADWQADARKWLRPRAQEIVALLRQLRPPGQTAVGAPQL